MTSQTMLSTPHVHGVKRRGDDSIDSEQRLSKRFDLLNLERNGKLWVPACAFKPPTPYVSEDQLASPKTLPRLCRNPNDSMQVDDTPDRIYIHNLDEELANLDHESEQERLVFLPDIEKKLRQIPRHVLSSGGDESSRSLGNEIILYSVPRSLTVPTEEKDSVRKAIIESRARARENLSVVQESRDAQLHDKEQIQDDQMIEDGTGYKTGQDYDPDAMDLG